MDNGVEVLRRNAFMVGCEGHLLVSRCGDLRRLSAADLFSVVVVWSADEHTSWQGWLTTRDRWSTSFSSLDLQDRAFLRWLGDLPGWDPSALLFALGAEGLHLVWRNPL
jgi:hypothetical protein